MGKPYGTHVLHSSVTISGTEARSRTGPGCCVDNEQNGRLETAVMSEHQELVQEHTLQEVIDILRGLGLSDASRSNYVYAKEVLEQEKIEER